VDNFGIYLVVGLLIFLSLLLEPAKKRRRSKAKRKPKSNQNTEANQPEAIEPEKPSWGETLLKASATANYVKYFNKLNTGARECIEFGLIPFREVADKQHIEEQLKKAGLAKEKPFLQQDPPNWDKVKSVDPWAKYRPPTEEGTRPPKH